MIVTGAVLIDLTTVPEDRQRHRVSALAVAPAGAPVDLIVGPLRVNPDTVRLLREYAEQHRLSLCVKGEIHAVGRWVDALRTGELPGMLL